MVYTTTFLDSYSVNSKGVGFTSQRLSNSSLPILSPHRGLYDAEHQPCEEERNNNVEELCTDK